MPGPYYSNRDEDLVLAGTQQTAPREYSVWGAPPPNGTLASEGMAFDSLPLRMALDQARALEYALAGSENDGEVAVPSSGHRHDSDFIAAMPWCQIESYRFATMAHAPDTTHRGFSYIVASTSYVDVAFVPLVLPAGITHVVPRLWMAFAAAAANALTVKLDLYAPADLATVSVSLGEVTRLAESSTFDGYMETDARGFDVSAVGTTDGLRLVFLRVQAKVSAGVAGLRQVQVLGSDQGYVAFPTRAPLDTTDARGDQFLTQELLQRLFLTNASRLRTLTFGSTYALPTRSRAHDHGEGRGAHLLRHLLSVALGPHTPDGGGAVSGGTIGVPLYTSSGADFSATPKLLVRYPLFVPGTYSKLKVILTGHLAGVVRIASLVAEVRPMFEDFSGVEAASGIAGSVGLVTGADGFAYGDTPLDLEPLGGVGQDRWYELLVWQNASTEVGDTYRLTGLCVYESAAATESALSEDLRRDPTEELAVAQLRENVEVTDLLTARLGRILNQLCYEALGGVPGYRRTLRDTDGGKPWRRQAQRHQHRGTYTDGSGAIIDDGAIVRMPLMSQVYLQNVAGSGVEGATAGISPPLGRSIHTDASLSDWPEFEAWITLPQGCTAFEIYGLIQPGTALSSGRLYCNVIVNSHDTWDDEQTIVTDTYGAAFEAGDNASTRLTTTAWRFAEVLPQESLAWQRNERRLRRGMGCWTTDALLRAAQTTDKLTTNPARWTQAIRVEVAPTYSGPYLLRVQWALQTGTPTVLDGGTYATTARLLAMIAVPAEKQ